MFQLQARNKKLSSWFNGSNEKYLYASTNRKDFKGVRSLFVLAYLTVVEFS